MNGLEIFAWVAAFGGAMFLFGYCHRGRVERERWPRGFRR